MLWILQYKLSYNQRGGPIDAPDLYRAHWYVSVRWRLKTTVALDFFFFVFLLDVRNLIIWLSNYHLAGAAGLLERDLVRNLLMSRINFGQQFIVVVLKLIWSCMDTFLTPLLSSST
jgi:hypothetical protein